MPMRNMNTVHIRPSASQQKDLSNGIKFIDFFAGAIKMALDRYFCVVRCGFVMDISALLREGERERDCHGNLVTLATDVM